MNRAGGLDLRQGSCELDPPLLAARQGCVGLRDEGKRIRCRETLLDDPGALSRGDTADTVNSEAHDFMRLGRERRPGSLASSLCASARDAPARCARDLRPRKKSCRGRAQLAAHKTDQTRFARAVGTDEDGHAPRFDIERDRIDQRTAAQAVSRLSRRQNGGQTPKPPRGATEPEKERRADRCCQNSDWHFRRADQCAGEQSAPARRIAPTATLSGRSAR